MTSTTIPFNRPHLAGHELDHIRSAIEKGQLAGDGPFTNACEAELKKIVGAEAILLTHSCTAALEMAALLLDLGPGDEVIMPSYTFVSTANAVVLRGATPVFVDIRSDTLNLDERRIEQAITEKTRAVFVVHYAGVPCDMDAILAISKNHDLAVVEDAAQALTSKFRDRNAGSIGDLACFSFHETKNIIAGEGGCLAINNPKLIERAEVIREKGTNRKAFYRGVVDKYTWVDIGSSYIPGELVAAFLYGQLESIAALQEQRLEYWNRYKEALSDLQDCGYQLPYIPPNVSHNGHLFYLISPTAEQQQQDIAFMKANEIVTPFHYVPLHRSPAGARFGAHRGSLQHTEDLSSRLLRLPLFPNLGEQQARVIDTARQFTTKR